MTFLERMYRRLGAVTPSTVGRVFRAAAAVTRSLDHENVAASGANRLAVGRRAAGRLHFDVGGGLSLFGIGAIQRTWDGIPAALKVLYVQTTTDLVVYDPTWDLAEVNGIRLEGATIECPDFAGMLVLADFQVIRINNVGAEFVLHTFNITGASDAVEFEDSFAVVVPADTDRFVIRLTNVAFHPDAPTEVRYPNLYVGTVLHFSTDAVPW